MTQFASRVSYAAASGALPAFTPGDLCLVHASSASGTIPSVPAGWTSVRGDNNASQVTSRIGWRKLQLGDTLTGTWTNADVIQVVVYSDAHPVSPIGNTAYGASGASGNFPLPDIASLLGIDGRSIIVWFGSTVPSAGSGDNMHSRTHDRLTNRSNGQTVHTLGHGDSEEVLTWTGNGDMSLNNGTFRKQSYSIEIIPGLYTNPSTTRITSHYERANRFFVQEAGVWRIANEDLDGSIVAYDLGRETHRILRP